MAHADGHIDLAVWPSNLRAGIIDRWAANLFFALLPFIDPGPRLTSIARSGAWI